MPIIVRASPRWHILGDVLICLLEQCLLGRGHRNLGCCVLASKAMLRLSRLVILGEMERFEDLLRYVLTTVLWLEQNVSVKGRIKDPD